MFVCRASTILNEVTSHIPELHQLIESIRAEWIAAENSQNPVFDRCLDSYNRKGRRRGLLNRRPRKILGFATPTEAFFGKSSGENFAVQS